MKDESPLLPIAVSFILHPSSLILARIDNQRPTSNNPLHASSFSKANLPFRTINTAEDSL